MTAARDCASALAATASAGCTARWRARCGSRCSGPRPQTTCRSATSRTARTCRRSSASRCASCSTRQLGDGWSGRAGDPETWAGGRRDPERGALGGALRGAAPARRATSAAKTEQDQLLRGEQIEYVRAVAREPRGRRAHARLRAPARHLQAPASAHARRRPGAPDPRRRAPGAAPDRRQGAPERRGRARTTLQRLFQLRRDGGERRPSGVVVRRGLRPRLARQLVSGCDVWVNLPRRPMEASGTSGMKATFNGALQLSVLDGWWAEAYDGANGWAIPGDEGDDPTRRRRDAALLRPARARGDPALLRPGRGRRPAAAGASRSSRRSSRARRRSPRRGCCATTPSAMYPPPGCRRARRRYRRRRSRSSERASSVDVLAVTVADRLGVRVEGRELERPAGGRSARTAAGTSRARAPALRSTRNESSVMCPPSRGAVGDLVAVQEDAERGAPALPVVLRHPPPVGAEPPDVRQPRAVDRAAGEEVRALKQRVAAA